MHNAKGGGGAASEVLPLQKGGCGKRSKRGFHRMTNHVHTD